MDRRLGALLLMLIVAHAAPARPADGGTTAAASTTAPTFESHWQDGRAELAGYRYRVSRYGEMRTGQATLITVTEPFSESKRVKVDRPDARASDTFEALKVNLVRDFQTGIYDYNTMTSVFVRSRDFTPVKVTFSSAEWCGHVYEELNFYGGAVRQSLRSYFEDESSDQTLPRRGNGVSVDQLFILVRSLRGEFLRPGERRRVSLLPGTLERRLAHRPLAWVASTIERRARTETIRVPAGSFETDVYRVVTSGGRGGVFHVETRYPHRIVRWTWNWAKSNERRRDEPTESAELLGSERQPYWRLHRNGDETRLKALGLKPLP